MMETTPLAASNHITIEQLKVYQKRLIKRPTKAEVRLRQRLIGANVSFEFQAIIPPYITDFAFPAQMLIVELDGKHHSDSEQFKYDTRRDAYLRRLGFSVLRVVNADAGTLSLESIVNRRSHDQYSYSTAIECAFARFPLSDERPHASKSSSHKRSRKQERKARQRAKTASLLRIPCIECGRMLIPTLAGRIIKHKKQRGHNVALCAGSGKRYPSLPRAEKQRVDLTRLVQEQRKDARE